MKNNKDRVCKECRHFYLMKHVQGIPEGMCIRFPPTIHPIGGYIPGDHFSMHPLVDGTQIACGEFELKQDE